MNNSRVNAPLIPYASLGVIVGRLISLVEQEARGGRSGRLMHSFIRDYCSRTIRSTIIALNTDTRRADFHLLILILAEMR